MTTAFATLPAMPRKPLPESEKKVTVSARVPPFIARTLIDMAAADDRKLAYMVEKALREFVEKHAPKPSPPRVQKR